LIERAESATSHAAGAEAGGKRARGLTEQAAAEGVGRQADAYLVEQVEGFGS